VTDLVECPRRGSGWQRPSVIDAVVQARGEPGGTQHTQLVLGEAKLGIADGADDAGGEVLATVDIVDYGRSGVAGGRLIRERVQQHPLMVKSRRRTSPRVGLKKRTASGRRPSE